MSDPVEVIEDRCDWHLDNWATWMRRSQSHEVILDDDTSVRVGKLGGWYPSRASGRMGVSGSSDFDTMVGNADTACAAAVDALIDDLPQHYRLAVYHVKLAAVFRFGGDIQFLYAQAKVSIRNGLAVRGIW